jgi:foldase protein PrsA
VNIRLAWGINIVLVGIIIFLVSLLIGDKVPKESTSKVGTSENTNKEINPEETVASVGEDEITEREWLDSLKELYGKEVLEQLINHRVVAQLAERNDIKISENELERQMDFFQSQLQMTGEQTHLTPEALMEEIKYSILFEEIITKDVVIDDQEIQAFYEENQDLFNLKKQYHISHIVVKDLSTAEQVKQELTDGGSFQTLAMEVSTDIYTRTDGGNLGWFEENSGYLPAEYWVAIKDLESEQISEPFETEEGYIVVYLHEERSEEIYELEDVKSQIRRQLAINQIKDTLSPLQFWNEIKVDWIYQTK